MKRLIGIAVVLVFLLSMMVSAPVTANNEIHVPGDCDTIQEAVNLAYPGDVIIVHAGTYPEEVFISKSDITIIGEPGATLSGPGYEMGILETVAIYVPPAVSGVIINGLSFENYRSAIVLDGSSGHFIKNNILLPNNEPDTYSFYDGINLANASYNQITGNVVTDCEIDGIWLGPQCDEYGNRYGPGSNNNLISYNIVSHCHGGIILDFSHYNQVLWNVVSDSLYEPDPGCGVFIGVEATYNLVSNNQISRCGGGINLGNALLNEILGNTISDSDTGINMGPDHTGYGPSNNTIDNNNISGCHDGIWLMNAQYNEILNNEVSNCAHQGISVNNESNGNFIGNNTVYNCNLGDYPPYECPGIGINNSSVNLVENNEVYNCGIGISIQDANENQILSNTIHGCGLGYDVETIQPGISIEFSSCNNLVQKNEVYNSGAGINCFIEANDNQILENTIYNCGQIRDGNRDTIRFGIGIHTSSDNLVENNEVYECARGIDLFLADENHVLNNTVYDCGLLKDENGPGICMQESNNNLVENNVFTNCGGRGIELRESSNENQVLNNVVSYYGLGDKPCPGILISISKNNLVEKNEIHNGLAGIVVENSKDNQILKNVVTSMVRNGIVLVDICMNNLVEKNIISNCRSGIVLNEAHANQILKNEITASTLFGIMARGSIDNLIKRNYVSGSGEYDLSDCPKPPQNIWEDNYYDTWDPNP